LADNSLYDERNKDVLQKHLAKQAEIKKQMEDVERKWLAAGEELDKQNSAG
jgi:hypothetical protein